MSCIPFEKRRILDSVDVKLVTNLMSIEHVGNLLLWPVCRKVSLLDENSAAHRTALRTKQTVAVSNPSRAPQAKPQPDNGY